MSGFTMLDLERFLAHRATTASAQDSYTAKLLAGGRELPAKKLGEEAVETVIAALGSDPRALVTEAADLVYHLLVVLRAGGVTFGEVMTELERRTGQSGLAEKASRGTG